MHTLGSHGVGESGGCAFRGVIDGSRGDGSSGAGGGSL